MYLKDLNLELEDARREMRNLRPAGNGTIMALNEQFCLGSELGKGINLIYF